MTTSSIALNQLSTSDSGISPDLPIQKTIRFSLTPIVPITGAASQFGRAPEPAYAAMSLRGILVGQDWLAMFGSLGSANSSTSGHVSVILSNFRLEV